MEGIKLKKNTLHKRKRVRRSLTGLVAACLLLGECFGVPASVQAAVKWSQLPENDQLYPGAKSAEDSERYVYILPKKATTRKGCTVIAYLGESQNIKLPSKIGNYKITNFGTAFTTLANIQAITIPSGYTTIESKACEGQKQLYRVSIPASVTSIAEDAFEKCDRNKLTIVTPYGSVAESYAFAHGIHCTNSTSVQVLPNGTTMYVGEQKTITILNTNQEAVWKSSNPAVVSVDANGMLTAKKTGTAKVSVTVSSKTYSYTFKVSARTQNNVLKTIWDNYVTGSMSDYEKAVAAEQWVSAHIKTGGTSSSVKTALKNGTVNYTGRANTYKKILEHYGLKVNVVKGSKNVENSVVIAGKTYKVSALTKVPSSDKSYTTTTLGGVAINKSTMNLSVGGTDTFKALGTTKKITYSSNNKKVATVTTSGKVTAKGAGIAIVTMKMGAKTYTVRVRVNK